MPTLFPDEREQSRERAVELVNQHVCVMRHLAPLFSCRATGYRAVAELRRQRQLRVVGHVVMKATGRPETVFCNTWKPKADQLRHEVYVTDFLLAYPEADVVRGWRVDRRIRPDAEMTLRGHKLFVELDTGEQSHRQVRERQLAYAGVQGFLLYVTLSERRMDGLIKHAEAVKGIALFTTLAQVLADPHGRIWVDCFGKTLAI